MIQTIAITAVVTILITTPLFLILTGTLKTYLEGRSRRVIDERYRKIVAAVKEFERDGMTRVEFRLINQDHFFERGLRG